jgi:ABC-type nitrate/sulfonate/bicarbonate transport system substrate-binding protein
MGFVILARTYELFNYPDSGLVASVKKIKEKPDEVKRVIKAGIRANQYIRANRDGTINLYGTAEDGPGSCYRHLRQRRENL